MGVILSDVTIRKRADAALNESEALFRELNADLERRVAFKLQARGRTWQLTPDLLGALNSEGYFETSSPAWLTRISQCAPTARPRAIPTQTAAPSDKKGDRLSIGVETHPRATPQPVDWQ